MWDTILRLSSRTQYLSCTTHDLLDCTVPLQEVKDTLIGCFSADTESDEPKKGEVVVGRF
jgi:hypothetical protein